MNVYDTLMSKTNNIWIQLISSHLMCDPKAPHELISLGGRHLHKTRVHFHHVEHLPTIYTIQIIKTWFNRLLSSLIEVDPWM
jgi:hypothetical protein